MLIVAVASMRVLWPAVGDSSAGAGTRSSAGAGLNTSSAVFRVVLLGAGVGGRFDTPLRLVGL